MRRVLSCVLVTVALGGATACRHAQKPAPAAASPSVVDRAAAPTLAAVGWLAGDWHSGAIDAHWQQIAGAMWGVELSSDGTFAVNVIDDADDDGKPAPLRWMTVRERGDATTRTVVSADASQSAWRDGGRSTRFERIAGGVREVVQPPSEVGIGFVLAPGHVDAAPEVAAAERAFAADFATGGAPAWMRWFAPSGGQWDGHQLMTGAAMEAYVEKLAARGKLAWTPVADGRRGEVGYTIGTWQFTAGATSEVVASGSYCTIWRKQPDGSWKVVLDTGRPG